MWLEKHFLGFLNYGQWECRNCGYRGAFIVEDSKLAEKIRENISKGTNLSKN